MDKQIRNLSEVL